MFDCFLLLQYFNSLAHTTIYVTCTLFIINHRRQS